MIDKDNMKIETATFAGGCFWCMVPPFYDIDGVIEVKSGYTGGKTANPTYKEVCIGKTGHYEAVQILYDPARVSYEKLLEIFWQNIDPTDQGGQFHDRGRQYMTAIFYHNQEQQELAEKSKTGLEKSSRFDKPIATRILEACTFYTAEEYHQDYHKKNPEHYIQYKIGSGREAFIEKNRTEFAAESVPDKHKPKYAKPSEKELKKRLTPLQYKVTQENSTEKPFENEYWDNKHHGIYVDIVSGEPLFSSLDKFDSGCGWPSFIKPLEGVKLTNKTDLNHFMVRNEVRSPHAGSHLGHVFNDGPTATGLRYCINSAALRFISMEDLDKEGYGEYKKLFEV